MNRLILLSIFTIIINNSYCQSKFKNGLFLELGGNAVLYSVNYERQFSKGLISRIGVCYFDRVVVVPLTIGKVFGSGKHHFEIDGGFAFVNYHQTQNNIRVERFNSLFCTGFIGYRYQKPDKKFFFRGGPTWLWFIADEDTRDDRPWNFMPWLGLSVGYRF